MKRFVSRCFYSSNNAISLASNRPTSLSYNLSFTHSLSQPAQPIRCFAKKPLKKKKEPIQNTNARPVFSVADALRIIKACAVAKFDETVELLMRFNVDAKKPNQLIRGVAQLPFGTGKSVVVAVFARGDKAIEAKKAGADIVGDQDLVNQVAAGKIEFNRCIATPDMMPNLLKIARVLGPRGLMPNVKSGTVTFNVTTAIQTAKQGQVDFKTEKSGLINAPIGKCTFSNDQLTQNISAFVASVYNANPPGTKTNVLKGCHIKTTMGKSVKLDIQLPPFKIRTSLIDV